MHLEHKAGRGLPALPGISLGELVEVALAVIRVEEVFSLLRAGLTEVILVESLDFWIEVAHADNALLVIRVETSRTGRTDGIRSEAGLTTAADATATACHDFDEVVARLDTVLDVFANLIENLLDIAHLVSDCNVDLRALDVNRGLLDAVHAANCGELDCRRLIFLRDKAVGRTESRFHNTAGDAEDRACTRVGTEQIIRLLFRKVEEVDTGSLDHAGELTRGENDIRILATRGLHVLVAGDLILLGRARHDGRDMHLVAGETVLLGPVGLGESGKHLLRGLGGREVLREVGSILLHPVRPCRAAARDERELAAVGEALDELRSFLHDRYVGGEVRVEHLLEAEHTESGIDLARGEFARLHAKSFAESDADGRSDLNEAGLLGVAEGGPNLGGFVVLVDCSDRAVRRALTALDAGRLSELDASCGSHNGLLAAADEFKSPHVLHLLAHFSAAAALDALVGVEDERRRGLVEIAMDDFLRERNLADAEIGGDILKFATAGARALQAVLRVVREDKLENRAAHLDDIGIVSDDLHAFHGLGRAGTEKLRARHKLAGLGAARNELTHHADAAACAGLEIRMVAEGGDLDVCGLGGHEEVGALRDFNRNAVYFKLDHFHCLKFLSRCLAVADCAELAGSLAGSALDALLGVDDVRILELASNRSDRALAGAERAALALVGVDLVGHELRALAGTALLVLDVLHVLIHEVLERGLDRVRGRLTKTAERSLAHRIGDVLHLDDVILGAATFGDLVEIVEELASADAAGSALSAALIDGEVEVELGDVDHAVRLVHDDQAAGTHDRTDLGEALEVDLRIEELGWDDAAGRTAGLSSLELMAATDTATDVEDDLTEGRSHRNFDEAGVVDLARESEHLGALRRLGTDLVEPVGALVDDDGDVGKRFDVVDDGRTIPETLHGRERRTGLGHAAVAFDGLEKSRLFTAHERTGSETELDVEREAAAEDVVAKEAKVASLLDCDFKTVNGKRIFCADVDEALGGANRVAGDGHCLEDGVGIAFESGAVHVSAGVAFVGVAHHVLLTLGLLLGELPLHSGGEACAAAAAEARLENLFDDLLGRHLEEHLLDGFVAVACDVVIDLLWIDHAAVAEHDAVLLLVERDVRFGNKVRGLVGIVAETLNDTTLDEMLVDDLLHVLRLHLHIERTLRKNLDDRTLLAETKAARRNNLNGGIETLRLQLSLELIDDLVTAAGKASGTAAYQNIRLISHFNSLKLRRS